MRIFGIAAAGALVVISTAGVALAKVPVFAGRCPTGITVDTGRDGGAFLNGRRASVRTINQNAFEIRGGGVIVSVTREGGGGPLSLSYAGPGRANGICEVLSQAPDAAPPARSRASEPSTVTSRDRQACLRAVRRETRNPRVTVLRSEFSQANNLVTIGVGPQRAPWRCLVKGGVVSEVMSLTDEGRL